MHQILFRLCHPDSPRLILRHFSYTEAVRRLLFITLTSTLLVSPMLRAQPQSNDFSVTYEQAILQSLQRHPALAGYEFRLDAANARVSAAGIGPRPELSLEVEDVAGTGDFSEVESAQTTLGVSWLLQCEVIDRRIDAAIGRASLITTQQQIATLDVAADTARYFLQALAQQERLALARQAQIQAQQALEDINHHVQVGKVPQAEASRARADLERRKLAAEDVEHEYGIAKHQLAAQWGERAPDFSGLRGSLTVPIPLVDVASLRQQVAANPELAVFLSRERIAEAEIAVAKAEAGIQWRLNAGIRRLEATDDYSLVAGVAVPIGSRSRNRATVAALMAEQNRYRAERQALEIALETRVYVMAEQMMHSRHVSDALARRIIPSLERALEDTQNAYRQGKYSYYQLATAQQDLIDARLSYLESQYTAHLYLIEIEKITGLSLVQLAGYTK